MEPTKKAAAPRKRAAAKPRQPAPEPDPIEEEEAPEPVIIAPAPKVRLPEGLVRASDVDPRTQDWLQDQIIAAGVLNIVAGPPGGSKTSWLIDFSGQASKGALRGSYLGKPMNVLYLSREDSAQKTLVPKLIAAGAWGTHLHNGDGDVILLSPDREDTFAFPRDTDKLATFIKEHKVGLIVLDSLMSFMDTKRSLHGNYQAAVESVMPLAEMCVKAGVTLIGVLHLKKDADEAGLNSIIGSIGIGATARHVVMMGEVGISDSRVVGVVKSNIGGEGVGEIFDVAWPIVGQDESTGQDIRASKITAVRPATEDEVHAMLEKRKKVSTSARDVLILSVIRDGEAFSATELLRKAPEIGVVQRQMRRVLQIMANRGLVMEILGTVGMASTFRITDRGLSLVNSLAPQEEVEEAEEEELLPRRVIKLVPSVEENGQDTA